MNVNINNNIMESKHHYTGLTAREVAQSRSKYGENVLTPPAKAPLWLQFLDKFRDPLIIILLIAGALSILISCYEYFGLGDGPTVFFEPVGIFVAIMLATGLSFYFEYQADKEFAILNKVNDDEPVEVIRDSNTTQIPRREVVVGDIVIVNTGEEIPADGELIEATLLNVDESTLTGEPMCTKTTVASEFDSQTTFPSNHVMKGTKVMEGHGVMRVLAIGDHTEQGKVFEAVQIDNSVKTPLDEQLDGLGRLVAKLSYCVGAGIIIGRILMYFLSPSYEQFHLLPFIAYLLQTLMIAVTLVVVSVPEGLPMAVTLSLAYSMRRMLKTNNLVRKMHACETMGATTVICTDKTGTLTQNRMQVADIMVMKGQDGLLNEAIALNTTADIDASGRGIGNPTESALLLWLQGQGADYRSLRSDNAVADRLPFSTERKYMATVAAVDDAEWLFVKGAPEVVMGFCDISNEEAEAVRKQLRQWQDKAMRTLAFACRRADTLSVEHLTLQAVVGISDPIREDVPNAVADCRSAGIGVKIVTGDTSATAIEIARQIGAWDDHTPAEAQITGPAFEALSDDEAYRYVEKMKVMSRARPTDKQRLVNLLQKHGEVVAVTGDGTNDAPALNHAHVGLSLGSGTSVAKNASDITLIDDSFRSIVKAVMWGRSLYKNIQRFLFFQLVVNVVALLLVLGGSVIGTELPLTVTQILWINLIMDTFAAMALASLPPTHDVMLEKPRRQTDFIITRPIAKGILSVGLLLFLPMMVFLFYCERGAMLGASGSMADAGMDVHEMTLFFTTFVMLQWWNLFNAKALSSGHSAFHHLFANRTLLFVLAMVLVGQWIIVTFGGQMFRTVPLSAAEWGWIVLLTSPVLWIGEIVRLFKGKKNK